jgi:hypothetical protein
MKKILQFWNNSPLPCIMILAVVFRILAVFFAKGYGMHDDHFLVLEWVQGWLDGVKINPDMPAGHSLVYPGIHYILFLFFKKIHFYEPEILMYIVRFFHAALSLATVYFGYKAVLLRSSKNNAAIAGLLLAIFWLFPFMNVRNLIEVVCIPFLVIAAYYLMQYEKNNFLRYTFIAGLFLGLSFIFRYQTNLYITGFFLVLIIRKQFTGAFLLCIGFAISSFCIQGITDLIAYGKPFASFLHYCADNKANAFNYSTGAFYVYFFTLLGILIPPTSILILFGFFSQWKKWFLFFLPTLIFLAFHSIFPNKQERFILPAVPFVIMIGIVGWNEFAAKSAFWIKHSKLHSGLWKWFWVVNTLLLLIVSTTYSKKNRVEVMNILHKQSNVTGIFVETSDWEVPMLPMFYLNKNVPIYKMNRNSSVDSLRLVLDTASVKPNYLVMMNQKRFPERQTQLAKLFSQTEMIADISPSLIDQLLYIMNPRHNVNQRCYIYKIKSFTVQQSDTIANTK